MAKHATTKRSTRHKTTRKTHARRTSTTRTRRKTSTRRPTSRGKGSSRRWSHKVTDRSDALDLREGVFKLNDPKKIAASLKRSAEHSHRRKSDPYRSAMSMLTFYINRGGKNLSASRKKKLEKAKDVLRALFHKA
ncbi:MAG: DUF3175 domain-containing protein [Variibacter sp.]